MCSTHRQRFFQGEKENRVSQPFKGQVRLLLVALDSEGSDAPLTCIVDAERIGKVARKAKVKDITRLYDNDKLPCDGFASADEVREKIKEIAARTKPHDYFVFLYSGHGASQENKDAPSGLDCMLCLRNRNGEDEELLDGEIAALIAAEFDPTVRVLMLCDACHSGGIMDVDTGGVWGSRKVCAISGCQEYQTSVDTGDGGAMTNALLKCIRRKKISELRRTHQVSIQYIFNRMVEIMPEGEEEEYEDEDEYEEGGEEEEDEEWCPEDEDTYEDEEVEEGEYGDDGPQNINLSWPGGCDPSRMPFPF